MSKFHTHIPIDVKAVEQSLPQGSHVNGVHLASDHKSVVVEWENDNLKTSFTFPIEITPETLAGKAPYPATVKNMAECKRVQNPEVAPTGVSAPQKAATKAKATRARKPSKVKTDDAQTTGQPASETGDPAGS